MTSRAPAPPSSLSYRDAGVDIDAGDALVERIKPYAKRTLRPEVLAGIGGFGALVELPKRYREPVLVAGTDGVGTKLKLAFALARHDTIGIDLVAMSVNDILVQGAEPLFFLDYYVCERLDVAVAADVVKGIAAGCEQAGCALIGGETAEHPNAFVPGEYDLAGFAVGVVEKSKAIDGRRIAAGDVLLGLASSGPHSNGFSLIRRILDVSGASLADPLPGDRSARTLGDALLEPTRIYVKPVLALLRDVDVKGMAHITGGGLIENTHRMFPDRSRGAHRSRVVAASGALRLAAARRQCRRRRNAPGLQLRHRLHPRGGAGRRAARTGAARRRRRSRPSNRCRRCARDRRRRARSLAETRW